MQDALIFVFEDILEFCQKALKLYEDKDSKLWISLKIGLRNLIERFVDVFGEDFDQHLETYKELARQADIKMLRQAHRMLMEFAQEWR